MNKILNDVLDFAKKILSHDGFLAEIALIFKGDKLLCTVLLQVEGPCSYDSRTEILVKVGSLARSMEADLVVHIADAAMRQLPEGADPTDITEAPLSQPKSMRTECIIVNGIKVPDGDSDVLIQAYKGGDGEPVEYIPYDIPSDAKFDSRFTEVVRIGWKTMDGIIKRLGGTP